MVAMVAGRDSTTLIRISERGWSSLIFALKDTLVKNYPKISHGVFGCQGNAESKTNFSRIFRDKYDDLSFI